jgi:hypothetical protein
MVGERRNRRFQRVPSAIQAKKKACREVASLFPLEEAKMKKSLIRFRF